MPTRLKWVFLTLLTIVFTTGIPSCRSEDYAAIRGINHIIVFDPEVNQSLASPASTTSDTIILLVRNEIELFSDNSFHFPGTMAEAWAFRPASPWVANKITAIRVFSNQPVLGQPANQNLVNLLKFGNSIDFQLSLDAFLETLPNIGEDYFGLNLDEFQIYIDAKPEKGTYIFTVEMEDNNGHVFSANTIPIEWK